MREWPLDGYFIVRNLIGHELALEIRGVLKNRVLEFTEPPTGHQFDSGGRAGDDVESRLSRARKLNSFGLANLI